MKEETDACEEKALIASWHGIYPREKFKNVFVIGLAGYAGAGKTTLADAIAEELGENAEMPAGQRWSFSKPLKELMSVLLKEADMPIEASKTKEARLYEGCSWSVRDFMFRFGVGLVKNEIGENFWVDMTAARLAVLAKPTVAVFDDLRFPGDLALVKALGMAVLIRRQGIEQTIKHVAERPDKLAIETVIENNSTPQRAARVILKWAQQHDCWPKRKE